MSLYLTISERLPRTPVKFHYIFNLRDLSRIFEGFCAGCLVITNTSPTLTKLGFKPNVHYVDCDLWEREGFVIPDDKSLNRIAEQGRKLFFSLVESSV